ncbi:MAG: MoaD/ThiS family protein, partial [Alphaproteobacteria bacterium]|nr:MoaD/ThiS family protein [Alphaproteobacteria bacterium]
ANNVRQMVQALEAGFPGLGTAIQQTMSVAIDGVILPDPYLETVNEDSEIFILPKIGGG